MRGTANQTSRNVPIVGKKVQERSVKKKKTMVVKYGQENPKCGLKGKKQGNAKKRIGETRCRGDQTLWKKEAA